MKFSRSFLIFLGLTLLGGIILFFPVFPTQSGKTLMCMDTSLATVQRHADVARSGLLGSWYSDYWLGSPVGNLPINLQTLCLLAPLSLTNSFVALLSSLIFGATLFFLCHQLRLSPLACLFGALAGAFSSHLLTMVYPGHLSKMLSYAFIPLACAGFLKYLETRRLLHLVVAGLGLALAMQTGEGPVAYFTGIWFAAWALLVLLPKIKEPAFAREGVRLAGGLAIIVCVVVLAAAQVMETSIWNVTAAKPITGGGDTDPNWQFATQFYFPPQEILSYITTVQFFGGPEIYWGDDGLPTPLRLSDDYMGLLPLGFAILGGIVCWRVWQARLFVIMGLVSLWASFGHAGGFGYGLYYFIYQLPTMKAQRNPHRWSFFVALAVCVLAAYGVDWLLRRSERARAAKAESAAPAQAVIPSWLPILSIAGLFLFALSFAFFLTPQSMAQLHYSSEQLTSPQASLFLDRTRWLFASLARTGCFVCLSAGAVWCVLLAQRRNPLQPALLPWVAVFIVLLLDLGLNAKRYTQFYDWKTLHNSNEIANAMTKDNDLFRVKAFGVQQHPLINQMVTFVLPYHRIPVADPPAYSRQTADYATFFEYGKTHYMPSNRYLDLFNIKYAISPQQFSDASAGFQPMAEWNGVHLSKREDAMPRAWLATAAKVVKGNSDAVLFETFHPLLNIRDTVILREEPDVKLAAPIPLQLDPPTPAAAATETAPRKGKARKGSTPVAVTAVPSVPLVLAPVKKEVKFIRNTVNRIEVATSCAVPSMLVLSEKWDADWQAWVDGQPAKIYAADFLLRGIALSAGNHQVLMEYRPPQVTFWITIVSMLIFGGVTLFLMIQRAATGTR